MLQNKPFWPNFSQSPSNPSNLYNLYINYRKIVYLNKAFLAEVSASKKNFMETLYKLNLIFPYNQFPLYNLYIISLFIDNNNNRRLCLFKQSLYKPKFTGEWQNG